MDPLINQTNEIILHSVESQREDRINRLKKGIQLCLDNHDYFNLSRMMEELSYEMRARQLTVYFDPFIMESLNPDWKEFFEKKLNILIVEEDGKSDNKGTPGKSSFFH